MRLLLLLLVAVPALAMPRELGVATTASGPLAVWSEDNGAVIANGNVVTGGAVRMAVAADGDFALVVWTEANGTVRAMRLNAGGTAAGVASAIGSNAAGPIAVAAAGDRYFIAWAGSLGEVYAALVSTAGVPLVPAMPVTAQSGARVSRIAAAANDHGFAAVWDDQTTEQVFALTLDPNGVPVSMAPLLLSERGVSPDVTSDGSTFFAVWSMGSIAARTFTVDRHLGRVRTVTKGGSPRVAWDGSAYSLAFARLLSPRGGFLVPVLATLRVSVYGTYAGELVQVPGFADITSMHDIDASGGRVDVLYNGGTIAAQLLSATVGEPRTRTRAARH
jgi:hypothetical protein